MFPFGDIILLLHDIKKENLALNVTEVRGSCLYNRHAVIPLSFAVARRRGMFAEFGRFARRGNGADMVARRATDAGFGRNATACVGELPVPAVGRCSGAVNSGSLLFSPGAGPYPLPLRRHRARRVTQPGTGRARRGLRHCSAGRGHERAAGTGAARGAGQHHVSATLPVRCRAG